MMFPETLSAIDYFLTYTLHTRSGLLLSLLSAVFLSLLCLRLYAEVHCYQPIIIAFILSPFACCLFLLPSCIVNMYNRMTRNGFQTYASRSRLLTALAAYSATNLESKCRCACKPDLYLETVPDSTIPGNPMAVKSETLTQAACRLICMQEHDVEI